jgi:hypothetical protein
LKKEGLMYGKSGEEAKQFVKKAIAFYKKTGKAVAMAEFTNPKGPFVESQRDNARAWSQRKIYRHGLL